MVIKLIHAERANRKVITHFELAADRPDEYPSKWFADHPGQKPVVMIMKVTDDIRKNIHQTIIEKFRAGTLSPIVATTFLMDEFSREAMRHDDAWSSFGTVIFAGGGDMTVKDIVKVEETEPTAGLLVGAALMETTLMKRYIIALCCVYRLVTCDQEAHREVLLAHMNQLITQPVDAQIHLNEVHLYYKSWLSHQPFVKTMACIDMYLNVFNQHKFAQARMGTIISRFKDCSVLVSTYLLTKSMGLTFEQFAPWIWTKNAALQFDRVVRGGQEMDNNKSYAMYFRDFYLSDKSPYSTQLNPDLHLLLHTIGTSGGVLRSSHARLVGSPLYQDVVGNAVVIYFVYGTIHTFETRFSADGEPLEEPVPPTGVLPSGMPNEADAGLWLGYLKNRSCVIDDVMWKRAYKGWAGFPGARPGSIGEFLFAKTQPAPALDDAAVPVPAP